eukprot:4912972-Pyramimonas_sp.AAC.1
MRQGLPNGCLVIALLSFACRLIRGNFRCRTHGGALCGVSVSWMRFGCDLDESFPTLGPLAVLSWKQFGSSLEVIWTSRLRHWVHWALLRVPSGGRSEGTRHVAHVPGSESMATDESNQEGVGIRRAELPHSAHVLHGVPPLTLARAARLQP